MLVLTRYTNERIFIGDDIIITVVDIRPDRVRIGIEAPAEVAVHREEIQQRIDRERAEGMSHPDIPRVRTAEERLAFLERHHCECDCMAIDAEGDVWEWTVYAPRNRYLRRTLNEAIDAAMDDVEATTAGAALNIPRRPEMTRR